MSVIAFSGPIITYQDGGIIANTPAGQNPDQGPSLFLQGTALLDPRLLYTYFPDDPNGLIGFTSAGVAINAAPAVGWLNAQYQTADYAPGSASTSILASGVGITATTTVTLTASSATTPYNVTTNSVCTASLTGQVYTGLWLIDQSPGFVYPGQAKSIAIWDVTNPPIGRAVSITTGSAGSLTGVTFSVSGYDAYGNPIVQQLPGATTSSTTYTSKTFKWIASVTASQTATTLVSVGVSDIYGLPFYASSAAYLDLYWNNTLHATSATVVNTFIAGSTATTVGAGDVRGTINLSGITASNGGTTKMQLWQSIAPANVTSSTGLFGVSPA